MCDDKDHGTCACVATIVELSTDRGDVWTHEMCSGLASAHGSHVCSYLRGCEPRNEGSGAREWTLQGQR